uniref:DNA topoisomerase (ATP-hydrolyzing) n=1 Tax=Peronospora matthiolae TaxID=2874970 RepID=A0AAV1UGA6_9STRA
MATTHGQIEATATGWSREEVLQRIADLAAEFLDCLSDGKVLDLEALKRNSSAMKYDHETKQQFHGNETRLIKLNRQGGRRYTGIWLILQTVHALLTEHKTATQRDVYYLHPFFRGQSEADEAILDAGSILGVPRGCMNIVGASKGCFTGDISLIRDNQWRYFGSGEEVSITQELLQLKPSEMHSNAKCIIVIEKDGIFNRLREDKFFVAVPSILITGRGFPDLATRMFVSQLSKTFDIPVLGLCDCNPFGLSIMLTYKLGSARMPLESLQYAVDVKWVGLRPSQATSLGLPLSSLKALTRKDTAVAESLLRASFVQATEAYKEEVQMWLGDTLPWKIELEALYIFGFTYLTSFLRDCIQNSNYL